MRPDDETSVFERWFDLSPGPGRPAVGEDEDEDEDAIDPRKIYYGGRELEPKEGAFYTFGAGFVSSVDPGAFTYTYDDDD